MRLFAFDGCLWSCLHLDGEKFELAEVVGALAPVLGVGASMVEASGH